MSVEPPKLPTSRAIGEARRRMWSLLAIGIVALLVQLLRRRSDDEFIVLLISLPLGLALGAILGIVMRRRDRLRARSALSAGALFGGTAMIRLPQLRTVPRLRLLLAHTKLARFTQGMVNGTMIIEQGGISWTPNPRANRLRVPRIALGREQIGGVDTGGLPGWGDPAALAVRLSDGSVITFQTRRLADLRRALSEGGYPAAEV